MNSEIYSKEVKKLKQKIQSYGMDTEFISWLMENTRKSKKTLNNYPPIEAEFYLLSSVEKMLAKIKKENPSNTKEFITLELRRKENSEKIEKITNQLVGSNRKDSVKLNNLEKQILELQEKVKKEDPEYFEKEKRRFVTAMTILSNKRYGHDAMI